MFVKNNRLIAIKLILTVLTCFLITILIKINFFLSYFINVDSAFYVKWFSDLSSTNQIFPNIKNNFLNNLLIEKGTFLHQLLRRYFNNASEIYTIIPTLINYLLMTIAGSGFKTFNIGSIVANSTIPLICSFYFFRKYKLTTFKNIITIIFIYTLFLVNFNFFYWAPLGIHNYSLLSLTISFLIIDFYYKHKFFFNLYLILLGILLPCFSHKFNVPLIFLTLFFVVIHRKNYSNNFYKELSVLLIIFVLVVLPLILGNYVNPKNIAFLNSFFSDHQSSNLSQGNYFWSFINYELNLIKSAIPKLFSDYYYTLNFVGLFVLIISLFKSKNSVLNFFLLSNLLIFIFLPVSNFSLRLFNYQLLIVFIIIIEYFVKNLNNHNKLFNLGMLIIFISFICFSAYKTFYANKLNNYENKLFNTYYKGNENLKALLLEVNKIIQTNPDDIVFGSYVTKDLFYSYIYEHEKNVSIDSFPAIHNLYKNRKNINYLKSLNINSEKLYSTYYLNILLNSKNKFSDPILDNFCEIRINRYDNCGHLKKIELFVNQEPIDELFYNGNYYSLFFYKIEPN